MKWNTLVKFDEHTVTGKEKWMSSTDNDQWSTDLCHGGSAERDVALLEQNQQAWFRGGLNNRRATKQTDRIREGAAKD